MFHSVHADLEPTPQLVASSCLFAIPLTLAAVQGAWINYAIMLNVLLSSAAYHSTKHPWLYVLDQASILFTGVRALTLLPWYTKETYVSSLVFFGYGYLIDIYGRKHSVLMWNPSKKVQLFYHILLHVIFTAHTSCVIVTTQ